MTLDAAIEAQVVAPGDGALLAWLEELRARRRVLPYWLGRLPPRWQWTPHNLLAHPLSEVLYQLGLDALSDRVHDLTVPYNPRDQRG